MERNKGFGSVTFYGWGKADIKKYSEDLRYYSNSLGWLHHFGEYDLGSPKELPGPLRTAFANVWHRTEGCDCLLAQHHGEYGIALVATYDGFAGEGATAWTIYALYECAKRKAYELSKDPVFSKAKLFASASNGYFGVPEVAAFFPWYMTTREEIDAAAARMHEVVYDVTVFPQRLVAEAVQKICAG